MLFDLAELERRQLTALLVAGTAPKAAVATAESNYSNAVLTLRTAIAEGSDTAVLALWERTTAERLATTEADDMPNYELRPWSTAILLGPAMWEPMGDVRADFKGGFGVDLCIEFGYKSHILSIESMFFTSALAKPIAIFDNNGLGHPVAQGHASNFNGGIISYGFRLADNGKTCFTPMLGWSWGTQTVVTDDIIGQFNTNGVALGLAYRLCFSRRYRAPGKSWLFLGRDASELTRWSVDLRAFATHQSYKAVDGNVGGWTIQLALTLGLGARSTRLSTP